MSTMDSHREATAEHRLVSECNDVNVCFSFFLYLFKQMLLVVEIIHSSKCRSGFLPAEPNFKESIFLDTQTHNHNRPSYITERHDHARRNLLQRYSPNLGGCSKFSASISSKGRTANTNRRADARADAWRNSITYLAADVFDVSHSAHPPGTSEVASAEATRKWPCQATQWR